ncbi:T9SS type A sorting domain-containing protein [Lacinutrix sp.]|uniref:T9SS type A sorting domain-containing protein n=1 Tax=Lacinutrix sp. TaxID=1937692 RepID=UPI0026023310|nr:T9SS type A sorting domain-containing protein [Lacinutrix sp.]MDG1715052.1 T9SS type A sorting domain-containing protein [Lacinutrix sp.]
MKQKLLFTLFSVFSCFSLFAQVEKLTVATNWLEDNKHELNIQEHHTFEMLFSRAGLAGETFRFYQMMNGVQVFDAEVTVHVSNRNTVTYYASTYKDSIQTINTTPSITETEAFNIALNNLNVEVSSIIQQERALFLINQNNETALAYRVFVQAYSKSGGWEVMVDAQTGAILSSKDIAIYYHGDKDKDKKKQANKQNKSVSFMATGSAMIYDTDPLTATSSAFGGQFVDGNDATNAALDAARTAVTLLDIELVGGQYRLRGPFTEIAELTSPNKGLFIQSTNNFEFNRQEDGFEAVNVYYHTDKSMRYINNDLGIALAPPQNGGVIRFDPHGASGADNSFYTSGTLNFGEGCVDDAEDADVILHELGHGLHDWITNGGLSQVDGLSEGSGDYWANSYKRSLGLWSVSDAARNFVFGWDGHNPCWNGRTTVYTGQYPTNLTGQIHTDGQMWATTLMEIWEDIGRNKTDRAFLEGLGMTNSGTNQENAAIAVRQAAIDMGTAGGYTCADIQAITDRFTAQGYNMPPYTCNLSVDEFAANTISIFPNPTNGIITLKNIKQEHNAIVFNMLGQKVKNQTVNITSNTMDVSNLVTGTYFIKFSDVDTVLKFIKE